MELTRSALGMLLKRYRSVLKKCHLLNVFGAIALAGAISLAAPGGALGANIQEPSVSLDQVVSGPTAITATNGNVVLGAGVNGANGTIRAEGAPSATVGNIQAIDAAGIGQGIIQGQGNALHLEATGNINSGAMTVNSAKAGQNIFVTGTLQTVTTDAQGNTVYGDVMAGGDISAFDSTRAEGSQAFDINVGNITAGGAIKGGDITTHGNLTADHVETFKNTDDTLQAAKSNPGTVTVNGTVNLPGDSKTGRRLDIFNIVGSENVLGNVQTGACISIQGNGTEKSTLKGGVLAVGGGSFTLANGIQATIKEVSFDITGRKARIHGGNPNAATILDLDKFIMFKGNILAEASWESQYALGAIRSISPDETRPGIIIGDGNIAVGANAMLGLGQGATPAWLYGLMKERTGHETPAQDSVRSMLALTQPLEIQNGFRVFLNGDLYSPNLKFPASTTSNDSPFYDTMIESGTFTQGANTMLVVNGANNQTHFTTANPTMASQTPGAISYQATTTEGNVTPGNATIHADAQLLITDTRVGETYVVLGDGFDRNQIEFVKDAAGNDTAWNGANLATENPFVNLVRDDLINPANGVKGRFQARLNSSANIFPGLDGELVNALDNAALANQIGNTELARTTGAKGTQFLSRAVNMAAPAPYGYGEAREATATIESAARMAVIGAVPQMALAANNAAGAAVTQRTSIATPSGAVSAIDTQGKPVDPQDRNKGFAMWIMPLYQSTNGFGMEAGNFDYDFSGALGGVALGADWTFNDALRAGILFNIGGGYATGSGDLHETTNNMNFWGIGAYAGWNMSNLGITADVNYTSTYNELKQDLPFEMGWDELKADVNAWALSVGLRAEYKFALDAIDIIPHFGARFINLNVDSYDITHHGKVIDGDSITQNIWTFPIGITLTKDLVMESGWRFKPLLDLNVTPATGDVKAKSKIRFTGTGTEAELDTKMMDYITYGGTVGLEFGKDNFSIGVNYTGQFGAESSAHGVFGVLRYEF